MVYISKKISYLHVTYNQCVYCIQELSSEISSRQSQISTVENDLNQVLLIFSGDELPLVTELGHQVTQCHVCLSELMEKLELVKQLSEVETVDGLGSLPSPLLDDVSVYVSSVSVCVYWCVCLLVCVCLCVCVCVCVCVCPSVCLCGNMCLCVCTCAFVCVGVCVCVCVCEWVPFIVKLYQYHNVLFLIFQEDPSVLDIAISNLPNHLEVSLDSSNRPSSLSGLEEADSGLDDLDTFPSSSSHHSWTYFDTETVKRKVHYILVFV